jgi:hypothetical protein
MIGSDEFTYFFKDIKGFKDFRHYTQKRYWSIIFDLGFFTRFEDGSNRMALPFVGDTLLRQAHREEVV